VASGHDPKDQLINPFCAVFNRDKLTASDTKQIKNIVEEILEEKEVFENRMNPGWCQIRYSKTFSRVSKSNFDISTYLNQNIQKYILFVKSTYPK
jgi:hypothetical protein